MIENLSSTEKHEILFKRFINIYNKIQVAKQKILY